MTPRPETDSDSLSLSNSVTKARNSLPADEEVTAATIVETILDLHPEYADGKGKDLTLEVERPDQEKRLVIEWLETIRELFDTEHEPQLHGRAVIIGLYLLDLDLRHQLDQNGFFDALEEEYDKPLDESLTPKGRSLRGPTDSVPTQPDRPLQDQGDDQLQRVPFAHYLARRIYDISNEEAYSVNLYGSWGAGKSTLLNFLDDELSEGEDLNAGRWYENVPFVKSDQNGPPASPEQSWQVVRFNAWQHQHVRPPWWALMDHVFQQSKAGFKDHLLQQNKDKLSLRNQLREHWWRLRSGRLKFLLGVAVIAGLAAFVLLLLPSTASFTELAQTAEAFTAIIAIVAAIWAGAEAFTNSLFGGSARAAQSYVESVGDPMNAIKDRFNLLISRIPQPVAIFIDDLDRCDCGYVVELLEGVQTLFTEAPVVFVVAADRNWLNNCFEEVYADQQSSVDTPGKSLGGLFLEKTFQFSTPVPTIPDEMKEEYWQGLLLLNQGETIADVETSPQSANEAIMDAESEEDILRVVDESHDKPFFEQQSIREEAVTRLAAPDIFERTEHVLTPFAPLLEPNPRAMKRLVNAYSVNRALATLGHIDIEREPLALWTILSLQYPELADYLKENPEMVEQVGQEYFADIGDELEQLFADDNVVNIVRGKPVEAKLDRDTVVQCAKIR